MNFNPAEIAATILRDCDNNLDEAKRVADRYANGKEPLNVAYAEASKLIEGKRRESAYTAVIEALRNLVKIIDDVGDQTQWADGPQTDRVFASYEFDEAREALRKAGIK